VFISRDTAGVIDFLKAGFGAMELARVVQEDRSIGHAECRIGDSIVMLFDGQPDWPATPAFLRLYVADSDAVYAQALAAGATSRHFRCSRGSLGPRLTSSRSRASCTGMFGNRG